MSAFIKSIDPNHLVAIGDEGHFRRPDHPDPDDWNYNGNFGVDWERNLKINTIDFGTVHLYPDTWEKDLGWSDQWITEHIEAARKVGVPVIFEEYGIVKAGSEPCKLPQRFNRDEVFRQWTDLFKREGANASLVWMIAGKDWIGAEGMPIDYFPDFDCFTFWERPDSSPTINIIKAHAERMMQKPPPPPPLTLSMSLQSCDKGAEVSIAVNPADKDGNGDGVPHFSRRYDKGTCVTLTTSCKFQGECGKEVFSHWEVDGENVGKNLSITLTMDTDHIATAHYKVGFECVVEVPKEIGLIHIPLKVNRVGDQPMELKTISDLFDALGGEENVNFLITRDCLAGVWRTFLGEQHRGNKVFDRMLTDDMSIITMMKNPVTLHLKGEALGTDGVSAINLCRGINLVGVPRRSPPASPCLSG